MVEVLHGSPSMKPCTLKAERSAYAYHPTLY